MYRRSMLGQLKLEIPFGVTLDSNNRWVKLSSLMPWEKIEEKYSENFKGTSGQIPYSGRLSFAALYIQSRLTITDEETVSQIQETPSMQYFCGYDTYSPEKPFDSSLMVHFRKRITAEMLKDITEEAFAAEALKVINKNEVVNKTQGDSDKSSDESDNESSNENNDETDEKSNNNETDSDDSDCQKTDKTEENAENTPKPKGTMLLDATCCPADIHYPTDIHLLNHARELTELIIDNLHEFLVRFGHVKPRTYRNVARAVYLSCTKKRKHTHREIRFTIRQQLQYIRRNLESITEQVGLGASLSLLSNELYRKLLVISELYRQQKHMYDEKTHTVEDRIVSISQPHIRPIVRGKQGASVEFGAKVATAHIGGFSFVIHMGYDNFSEAQYLKESAEEYKRMFGFYPEVIIGDKLYATNDNRKYCDSKGIRLSAPKRGRKSEEVKEAERKQLYEDGCVRNAIEGDYGVCKRKYGLDLVMTKLFDTTLTTIAVCFFVKNMERVLRFLFYTFWDFRFHFTMFYQIVNPQ